MRKSVCVGGELDHPSSPGQAQGLGTLRSEAALGQGAY